MSVWTERSQKSICCLKATRYAPFGTRYGRVRHGLDMRHEPRRVVVREKENAPFVRRYRSEIRSATRAQAHIVANTFGALLSMTNGARASSGAQRALIFQTNNLRKADSFRR